MNFLKKILISLATIQLIMSKTDALVCYRCSNCGNDIAQNPTETCTGADVCGVISFKKFINNLKNITSF